MPFSKNYKNPLTVTREIPDLYTFIKDNAGLYKDSPVYTYYSRQGKTESLSYNSYFNEILSLGASFDSLGLSGKNICVIGAAHPSFMSVYYACIIGGGVIFPLDKDLSDEELVKFIAFSEADAVVYMPCEKNRFDRLVNQLTEVKYFISVAEDFDKSSGRILYYYDLIDSGKTRKSDFVKIATAVRDRNKVSAVIYTSGTTGTSKGIMLSENNLCAATLSAARAICYLPCNVKILSVLPMNHTYEVTCVHLASTFYGSHVFLNNSLKYFSRNIRMFKPDLLVLVPLFAETLYKKIIAGIEEKKMTVTVNLMMHFCRFTEKLGIDLRKKCFKALNEPLGGELKGIICGGAPLNPDITKFFAGFGVDIVEGYGITECSPLVSVNRLGKVIPGSVGTAVERCSVKTDSRNGNGDGEILVKGANVMLGYYKNPEASKEAFTADGWFKTGDIGHIDTNGYIFISGRKKNLIILSNGKNIYPEELEEYLLRIEEISECVVVSRKNKTNEEVLTAIVFPDSEKTKNMTYENISALITEKINAVNTNLPAYKQIHGIEIRDTEFEKTTTHKIKRFKVR